MREKITCVNNEGNRESHAQGRELCNVNKPINSNNCVHNSLLEAATNSRHVSQKTLKYLIYTARYTRFLSPSRKNRRERELRKVHFFIESGYQQQRSYCRTTESDHVIISFGKSFWWVKVMK